MKEFGAGEIGGMVNCRERDNDTLERVDRKNLACNFVLNCWRYDEGW